MLYFLLARYADQFILFNLIRYLTFRTGAAMLTSLIICWIIGPRLIAWLKNIQHDGQPIRSDGPESHQKKKGTPTMGGLMSLIAIFVSTILWVDISNIYLWVVLVVMLGFGAVGFADDYMKLTKKNPDGVSGRVRLSVQLIFGAIATWLITMFTAEPVSTSLAFPFVKDYLVNLGWFFIPWGALVMAGAANAVNLTDGLDGLASGTIMLAAACFLLISYLAGNAVFANYLQINHVPGAGEVAVFCGALIGACLGFLWYNAPPAQVFMGDTGALALGGSLGAVAVITKHEIVLAIVGGLFVAETLSVMIQVAVFKATGKRVFRMAPLHHHFEKLGWPETTVVIRFWIIAGVLALLGLSTLKLR